MFNIIKSLKQYRILVSVISNPIANKVGSPRTYSREFVYKRSMSQKSITSFFKITPKKSPDVEQKNTKDNSRRQRLESNDRDLQRSRENSPIKNSNKRNSKRQRLDSSGSESSLSPLKSPSINSDKKKKVKRQRIDSSGSEEETSKPEPFSPDIKVEKSDNPPKTYESPKSKKAKVKAEEISPLLKKGNLIKKKSPTPKKAVQVKEEILSPLQNQTTKDKKRASPDRTNELIVSEERSQNSDKENNASITAPEEYEPAKPQYHPVADACWAAGEEVPYLALARTLQAIEATSARLKIVDTLANYFRSCIALTPADLLPSVYLCLNRLAPAYHSLELGIAETYLMKAIGQCTGRSLAQVRAAARRRGDLGAVAESARAAQRTMCRPPALRLRRVFAALRDVARLAGQSSVNKKIAKIQSLYVACRNCEAKFLIRSLEGKLRVGLAEQSVLQALAVAVARTPPGPQGPTELDASRGRTPEEFKAEVDELALILKTTYCECPNFEAVLPALLAHGARALPAHCRLAPGVPLKPMLAQPARGVRAVLQRFESEQFTCEFKYDGERAQIHVPARETGGPDLAAAAVFSRNQENNTSKYPDVLRRLPGLLKDTVSSCVLDCEAVAYDPQTDRILPFQVLSTRKRKDAAEADIKVQVCVFVFDLLFLNGSALVRRPLAERRQLLREHLQEVPGEWKFATSKDCTSVDEMQQFLEEAVKASCEGLMVKTLTGPHAKYDIARRSHNWLKLKKDYLEGVGDTLDVVVIGGYRGRGKRAGVFGGFLLACYDQAADQYQSLCKIGTGFGDDDLVALSQTLQAHVVDRPRPYYSYDRQHTPDAWFEPACVWEVRCADLSLSPAHRAAIGLADPERGISLRFPRFVRVREDKTPEQATSAQQVAQLYLAQDQIKNSASKLVADDFY